MRLKKILGRTTVRGHTNWWKTWPLWNRGKRLLSKIGQEYAWQKILNRWTEYCSELYNYKANGYLSVLSCPQTDTEDDHPILRREVEAVVQSLKKGKSDGVDKIQAELVQAGGEDVITALKTICNQFFSPLQGNGKQTWGYREALKGYARKWFLVKVLWNVVCVMTCYVQTYVIKLVVTVVDF